MTLKVNGFANAEYDMYVPFAFIGKTWKLPFAGWSRQAKSAFHQVEISFFLNGRFPARSRH